MVKKTLLEWVAGNGGSIEHGVRPHQEQHYPIQYHDLPTRMPTLSHVVSANSRGAIVRMHRTTLEKSDMLVKEQGKKEIDALLLCDQIHTDTFDIIIIHV